MSASTERIAIWILEALKAEWERDPSHLTCRTDAVLLGSLKPKHNIGDADISRGINFLVSRSMLSAVNRSEGRASFPSERGFEYLAAHISSEAARRKEAFDRRFRVYAVIVAIIATACAVVGLLLKL